MENNDMLLLSEFTQFPLHVTKTEHHGKISLHSHNFYELVYIERGFSMHICDDMSTVLTSGDLFLIHPGQRHTYINACHTVLYNCLFTKEIPEFVKTAFREIPWCSDIFENGSSSEWKKINLNMSERNDLALFLEKIRWECNNRPIGWQLNVISLFSEMMVFISRVSDGYKGSEHVSSHIKSVHAALAYIEDNLSREFTVKEIADHVGLSPDYLSKNFKSIIGVTPIDYIKNYKIARAMEKLRSTEDSISDIAESVGFIDMSHFSRTFRQVTGVTPSAFRKSGNIGDISKDFFRDPQT